MLIGRVVARARLLEVTLKRMHERAVRVRVALQVRHHPPQICLAVALPHVVVLPGGAGLAAAFAHRHLTRRNSVDLEEVGIFVQHLVFLKQLLPLRIALKDALANIAPALKLVRHHLEGALRDVGRGILRGIHRGDDGHHVPPIH